eukprot:2146601-Rhodomonas_salina.2
MHAEHHGRQERRVHIVARVELGHALGVGAALRQRARLGHEQPARSSGVVVGAELDEGSEDHALGEREDRLPAREVRGPLIPGVDPPRAAADPVELILGRDQRREVDAELVRVVAGPEQRLHEDALWPALSLRRSHCVQLHCRSWCSSELAGVRGHPVLDVPAHDA